MAKSKFYLRTDFFEKPTVKALQKKYGLSGSELFIYMLCEVYKSPKSQLIWNSTKCSITALDRNVSEAEIEEMLQYMVEHGMLSRFDAGEINDEYPVYTIPEEFSVKEVR